MEENSMNKRGRKPIAPATPDELLEFFDLYRNECREDGIIDPKTGAIIPLPLTRVGFMDFLDLGYRWRRFKEYYASKDDFWAVTIARIENAIERNQLEGALVGSYNSNLVARLNGYTEKTENTNQNNVIIKVVD